MRDIDFFVSLYILASLHNPFRESMHLSCYSSGVKSGRTTALQKMHIIRPGRTWANIFLRLLNLSNSSIKMGTKRIYASGRTYPVFCVFGL